MARASRLPPFPQNEIMWTKRRGPCDLCCMDGDDCLMVVEVLYIQRDVIHVFMYTQPNDATGFYALHAGVPLGVLMGVANVSC